MHPLGEAVCRGHAQYPAFVPGTSEVAAGFWPFCILLFIICPNCACVRLLLAPYSLFVSVACRGSLSRCKPSSKGSQVPACLRFCWLLFPCSSLAQILLARTFYIKQNFFLVTSASFFTPRTSLITSLGDTSPPWAGPPPQKSGSQPQRGVPLAPSGGSTSPPVVVFLLRSTLVGTNITSGVWEIK